MFQSKTTMSSFLSCLFLLSGGFMIDMTLGISTNNLRQRQQQSRVLESYESAPTPSPTTSFQGYLVDTLDTLVQQNNVLQSKIDHLEENVKSLVQDSSTCFTGNSDQVRAACNNGDHNCCTGSNSCSGWGNKIHTVCENSCNGESACRGLNENVTIYENSCNGYYVCNYLGNAIVEANACVGRYACVAFGDNDGTQVAVIQSGACVGEQACGTTDQYSGSADHTTDGLQVGVNSCVGNFACTDIATTVSKLEIGRESCIGDNACREFAYYTQSSVPSSIAEIGEYSCVGTNACRNKFSFESNDAGLFLVEDHTCQGDDTCYSS